MKNNARRRFWERLFAAGLLLACAGAIAHGGDLSITEFGAKGDGTTLNTKAIQATIDEAVKRGGGTVVVPKGVFVSGAVFLKPSVNLRLDEGAVLQCSTDMKNFPEQRTRIEGHFEEHFNPALINADGCDNLEISGKGTLDGAGKPIWDSFWKKLNEIKGFKNLDQPRARLCLIENSRKVQVHDISFIDSQFWNLHLYNCRDVTVTNVQFKVPDNQRPPSSDGIDIDSCQDITINNCYFSVNDDCIALKGTKGPFAMEDKTSPPVERIRISGCVFKRGHGMVTCGSEATVVRDVVVDNCKVEGSMPMVRFKLRPDTPQRYENFSVSNITVKARGASIFAVNKWSQYYNPQGQPEPKSFVGGITVSGVSGEVKSLGVIQGNAMTSFGAFTLENIDVKASSADFNVSKKVDKLSLKDVKVNGRDISFDRK
jgi:alpha-L-rhamnosidase